MTTPREAALSLAAEALHAAQRENWPAATTAVKRISDEHGGGGLALAIVGWCDTLIAKHPALKDGRSDGLVGLAWTEAERGGLQFADDVPPQTRWAGQVLMARAMLDQSGFDALMLALPDDGWKIGEYVGALLHSVALTLNRIAVLEAKSPPRMRIGPDIELLCDAATIAASREVLSIQRVQRLMRVGYAKANRLYLLMQEYGILGDLAEDIDHRRVLITQADLAPTLDGLRKIAAEENHG
jgi:hypothetical protein